MTRIFLIFFLAIVLFGGLILAKDPFLADALYDEESVFENLSVAVCGIALLFSLTILLTRLWRRSEWVFWLALSLLLVIFIGDDISWGIRYFGFKKHKIAGIGFDGVHDIFSISIGAIKVVRDYIRSIGVFDLRSIFILAGSASAVIIASYLSIKAFIRNRDRIHRFFLRNLKWEPFLFLLIGIVLIAAAMFIDDDNLVSFPHKEVVEESLEFIAAVAFLFACLAGFRERCDV